MRICGAAMLAMLCGCGGAMGQHTPVMTAADVLALDRPRPDHHLSYGDDRLQYGELRLPGGEGPHPVVIVIHGGCWLAEYDLGYISAFADALADSGVATWSIEYRRVGDDGGGWPGTFRDVADAADHVLDLALEYDLDDDRVVAVGHSAGGHLALWLAARSRLGTEDPLRGNRPITLNGVVTLAGIPDLAAYAAPDGCGSAVPLLLGGEPDDVPERLDRASPIAMVPLDVAETLVIGELDTIVPASQAYRFTDAARRAGDTVSVVEISGAGHFELVDPAHRAFEVIRERILALLERSRVE